MLRGNTDSEPQLEKNKTKMANGREQEKSNESRLVSCALHAKNSFPRGKAETRNESSCWAESRWRPQNILSVVIRK